VLSPVFSFRLYYSFMNTLTSPKGIALSPYLNQPDTKFNPDGDYKVTLVLDNNDETQGFLGKLQEAHEESINKAKKENPGKKIKVADLSINDEAEEGKVHVSFKLKAVVKLRSGDTFTQKPALFDAAGKPMNKAIGGGSTIKVAFEPIPFYTATVGAGLTLRLKAVQVISLSSGVEEEGSAASFGFKPEEGYIDDGVVDEGLEGAAPEQPPS
jgi:hypothetical protein